jgi:hypothetical protein
MNKEEAINTFVKQNLSFLTTPDATQSLVKGIRLDFCNKMNLTSSAFFKNKDIAEAVIRNVSRIKKNDPDTLTQELMKIPFISKEFSTIKIREIIIQNIGGTDSILTTKDLSQLQHDEYLKSIEKQFEESAKKRVNSEMAEQKKKLDGLIAEVEKDKEYLKKI